MEFKDYKLYIELVWKEQTSTNNKVYVLMKAKK